MPDNFLLKDASWSLHKLALAEIRRKVFIEEQKVPEELEWDKYDLDSFHVLAIDNHNRIIGCGRLKPDGQIGRMAVTIQWRNKGVGTAILKYIIEHAKENNFNELYLHAQTNAITFYEKHGFKVCSNTFIEAEIPHKSMRMILI